MSISEAPTCRVKEGLKLEFTLAFDPPPLLESFIILLYYILDHFKNILDYNTSKLIMEKFLWKEKKLMVSIDMFVSEGKIYLYKLFLTNMYVYFDTVHWIQCTIPHNTYWKYILFCLFCTVGKFSFPHFHARYSCCLDKKYDYLNMFYWTRK